MINYTKKTWVDYPNTSTPITASELNTREQAFYDLATQKLDISQAQGLTDTQKAQARTNISAESIADANQIKQDLTQLSDEVGINLWDGLMRNGHIDSTTHKYVSDSANAVSISYIPVIEGSTIYMQTSSFTAFGNYYWYFWDSNKNYISGGSSNHTSGTAISRSISVPSGVVFMTIQFNTTGVISDGTDVKVCINRSNPAINGTYYPFRGLRKQITEVSNETLDIKMLGWSVPKECPIQNYMDADRKFHQRVGRVDLGSLNWSYNSSYGLFYGALPTAKMGSGTASNVNGLCVNYELKYITSVAQLTDKTLAYGRTAFVGNDVTIKDSSYTTASAFKAAMPGVYLYYELANEILHNEGSEIGENIKRLGNAIGMRGWNQLEDGLNFVGVSNTSATPISNGYRTHSSASYHQINSRYNKTFISGHIYIASFNLQGTLEPKTESSTQLIIYNNNIGQRIPFTPRIGVNSVMIIPTQTFANYGLQYQIYSKEIDSSKYFDITNFTIIDLTALFGAGNEPSSVEEFRVVFPADYYPYYAGEGVDDASGLNLTSSVGTISNIHFVRIGRFVCVSFAMTLSSAVSVGTIIADGLPKPATAYIPLRMYDETNGALADGFVYNAGRIHTRTALTASHNIYVNATYITT